MMIQTAIARLIWLFHDASRNVTTVTSIVAKKQTNTGESKQYPAVALVKPLKTASPRREDHLQRLTPLQSQIQSEVDKDIVHLSIRQPHSQAACRWSCTVEVAASCEHHTAVVTASVLPRHADQRNLTPCLRCIGVGRSVHVERCSTLQQPDRGQWRG